MHWPPIPSLELQLFERVVLFSQRRTNIVCACFVLLRDISSSLVLRLTCTLVPTVLLSSCRHEEAVQRSAEDIRLQRFGEHGDYLKLADRIEIFSIASTEISNVSESDPTRDHFHAYEVIGKIELDQPNTVNAVWKDLLRRVDSRQGVTYTYCFFPRHGIRAHNGNTTRDYLICFQCDHLYVYPDPKSDDFERIGLETSSAPILLNDLLDEAGIFREIPILETQ